MASREQRLQNERALIPSPEVMRSKFTANDTFNNSTADVSKTRLEEDETEPDQTSLGKLIFLICAH